MKYLQKHIIGFGLLLIANALFAQQISNDVQVIAPYQPTISDAYKINYLPVIKDTAKVEALFDYSIESKQVKTDFEVEPIAAATMLGEPLTKLYRSNIKFGFGNHLTPMLDFNYSTLRSKTKLLGVNLGHLSSNSNIKLSDDIKSNADYSNNYIDVFGKFFFKTSTLSSDLYCKRDVVHYYGYNVERDSSDIYHSLNENSWKQRFINAGGNIRYNSNHADSSHLNYNILLNVDYIEDINAINQKSFNLKPQFNKFYDDNLIGVDLEIASYLKTSIVNPPSNTLVKIKPWASMFGDKWRATAGLNLTTNVIDGTASYHFYPKIDLQYNIADNILIPYIGFNGDIIANDFKKSIFENPFLNPLIDIANSNLKKNIYTGVRGSLSSKTTFNIRGSYSEIDNEHFFVNSLSPDSIFENTFDVVYDKVDLMNAYGEILTKPSDKLSFLLKGNYYYYKTYNIEKAWHKPQYDVTLNTKYNLRNKIVVNADVFVIGKRFAKSNNPTIDYYELSEIVDVNLGIEYRYSKILSAFVKFNNLTSSKYQKWNFYPSQRFNFIAGFSYSL